MKIFLLFYFFFKQLPEYLITVAATPLHSLLYLTVLCFFSLAFSFFPASSSCSLVFSLSECTKVRQFKQNITQIEWRKSWINNFVVSCDANNHFTCQNESKKKKNGKTKNVQVISSVWCSKKYFLLISLGMHFSFFLSSTEEKKTHTKGKPNAFCIFQFYTVRALHYPFFFCLSI